MPNQSKTRKVRHKSFSSDSNNVAAPAVNSNNPKLEFVAVNNLKPPERPLRAKSEERIQKLCTSLESNGQVIPVIIDVGNHVIIGEERLEAQRRLNYDEIPAIRVGHLNKPQLKALRLLETKVDSIGELDFDSIHLEIQEIVDLDRNFDLDLTGFEIPELDMILSPAENCNDGAASDHGLEQIELNTRAVSQPGDIWLIKNHRLKCGDIRSKTSLTRLMANETAAQVLTDPPYNVQMNGHAGGSGKVKHREFVKASGELSRKQFRKFLLKAIKRLIAGCNEGASLYIFMDWRSIDLLIRLGRKLGLTLLNVCVWNKTNSGMGTFYRSQHELIAVFRTGKKQHRNNIQLGRYGRHRSNVWTYAGANTFGKDRMEQLKAHPTVKPVGLIADAIKDTTKRGDIILDGFAGSGTVLIAAELTGRKAYAMEIDPLYVDVAIRRFEARFSVQAIHEATGLTFSELATKRQEEVATDEPRKEPAHAGRVRTRGKLNLSNQD